MFEQREQFVARWNAERDSKPTVREMERWTITATDLEVRWKLEADPKLRTELLHRLSVAYMKMERYQEALSWAERGLQEGAQEFKGRFLEAKAQALYLAGRPDEAMAVLEEVLRHTAESPTTPERIVEDPTRDTALNLLCPECSKQLSYRQKICPHCGARVDDRFTIVRPSDEKWEVEPDRGRDVHRTKSFSFWLSTYTVDYDDPDNFLTIHRERFMGGEAVTYREKAWFKWGNLAGMAIILLLFGSIFIPLITAPGVPPAVILLLMVMMVAIMAPMTWFYLWVMIPSLEGPMA